MVTVPKFTARSSVHIAPLQINKSRSRDPSNDSTINSNNSIRNISQARSSNYQVQMTPPATPNGSQEDLDRTLDLAQPVFHNFLRAFYPFHPVFSATDSTVTLPLNEGDVILVHSIHTNGWADGTLLISGDRGWLPTNYCQAYEPESMGSLLKALLNFWDLLRSGLSNDSEIFGNQEFMRGIIAGVRYLLERSNCLTRESARVQSNEGLRRARKALLSDLSSLVKTAKRLQECTTVGSVIDTQDINDHVDDMVLKAFKIITRGVRFLDVLEEDMARQALILVTMPTVEEESYIPPTPPADVTTFDSRAATSTTSSLRASQRSSASSGTVETQSSEEQQRQSSRQSSRQKSTAYTGHGKRPTSTQIKRSSLSHRVSVLGPASMVQRANLISERLGASHDTLLSYLGSFIGRLHLQSQSPRDLISTTRASISAGRALLTIVEVVCAHDAQCEESLQYTKDTMYSCINDLVKATRDCVRPVGADEYEVMSPQENMRLKDAATACVIAAGECVAKTKFVIERIGDFELESENQGLGIEECTATSELTGESSATMFSQDHQIPPEPSRPAPLPSTFLSEKPLPHVPEEAEIEELETKIPETCAAVATPTTVEVTHARSSTRSLLPPIPKFTSPIMLQDHFAPGNTSPGASDTEFQQSFRSDSVAVSNATNSTYISSTRDSESSILSQTSTRATTPDALPATPTYQSSFSNLSFAGSQATLGDDMDDAENAMLEKTFAHELLHNKEGQVTGGSLPALVEKLTTYDSTPDAMFVSTFYLTFRLFVTPVVLARALIDRFDHVADTPHIATPVRLRVYNVFKGWLESHWRNQTDVEALPLIETFAQNKLCISLPSAGRRLVELVAKVSSAEGSLVPRLISSMGKTNTAITQYISPDTPVPTPVIKASQLAALKNWKMGGSTPTLLDFDALEVARQFTIKEMNIFCAIMPEELLASEWMKKSGSNAVNVRAMSTLSTDLSNLVADTILHYDDAKKRALMIKHWIKIAAECLKLNNYDSLMAIICSLNSSTIARLKKTWPLVSQKRKDMLKIFQEIVEPTKNHAVLRQRLQNHVPPCLPFVGTYLTDLTFVDIGNPATKQLPSIGDSNGISVINFDKHTRTAKIIGELQRFQIPYRLQEIPELQEWMQAQIIRVRSSNESNNVQQYYRKSLMLEPRPIVTTATSRPSPIESQGSFSNAPQSATREKGEKFDLFAWTHSTREKNDNVKERTSNVAIPVMEV